MIGSVIWTFVDEIALPFFIPSHSKTWIQLRKLFYHLVSGFNVLVRSNLLMKVMQFCCNFLFFPSLFSGVYVYKQTLNRQYTFLFPNFIAGERQYDPIIGKIIDNLPVTWMS